ncbi:MAG: hypothetical protein ACYTEK_18235 [Planctomycetota bacterium]
MNFSHNGWTNIRGQVISISAVFTLVGLFMFSNSYRRIIITVEP